MARLARRGSDPLARLNRVYTVALPCLTSRLGASSTRTMTLRLLAIASLLCGCLSARTSVSAADGWHELFNGRDLTGWKANVHPDSFRVIDGLLRAHCTHPNQRSHLFYVGASDDLAKFKNFELVVVFRGEPSSNSGIFFHTDMSTRDKKLHLAKGYEVNMNNIPSETQKTGSLYSVVTVSDPGVDDTNWTTLHLAVRDKRIVVKLNGEQVVDYTEPEHVQRPLNRRGRLIDSDGGAIALQAHDPGSVYFFKAIRIRETQMSPKIVD